MTLLAGNPWEKPVAQIYATLIAQLRRPIPQDAIVNIVRPIAGEFNHNIFFPKEGRLPAMYVGSWGEELIVLIDGITTQDQATFLIDAYGWHLRRSNSDVDNDELETMSGTVMARLNARIFPSCRTVTIAGYSLGGAIAQRMCPRIPGSAINLNFRRVVTFGSPRAGGNTVNFQSRAAADIYRWFHKDDPIPIVPPRPEDSFIIAAIAGRLNSRTYAAYSHATEGRQIDDSGMVTAEMLPQGASCNATVSLAAWLFGIESVQPNKHGILTYVDALSTTLSAEKTVYNPPQGPAEPAVNLTARSHTQAENRVVNQVLTLERQQGNVPVSIPPVRVVRAVKLGRLWGVYFGDTLITVRPGRRIARHIARSLNEFLERLQGSAVVSPDALVATMQSYLAAASDPAGGFSPVMNVTFPQ